MNSLRAKRIATPAGSRHGFGKSDKPPGESCPTCLAAYSRVPTAESRRATGRAPRGVTRRRHGGCLGR